MSRTFQHVKLVPGMTVLENVALGAHLRASTGSLAAMLRLDRARGAPSCCTRPSSSSSASASASMLHELAGNLALGPQRLVEIARALASDPRCCCSTSRPPACATRRRQALAELLRQLRGEGLSLLLVEHDMEFVMNLTDRIVVMEFGTKLIEDTPAEVQTSPAVREAYLGS